jgi:thiol-disulfide isomerase/thioredoxin
MRGVFGFLLASVVMSPAMQAAEPATSADIGDTVSDVRFKDRLFLERRLSDFTDAQAIVIVASNTTCPIVQKYWPKLIRLHEEFASKNVQFVAMNVTHTDSITDISAQAVQFGVPFPFVKDVDGQSVAELGLTRTPEVVVLDSDHRLCYRGRIDDQHRIGASTPKVRKENLKDAITAVLDGNDPLPAETSVDGCLITAPPEIEVDPSLTWNDHILPLFNTHCNDCHKAGTEAPFGLPEYDDVAGNAQMIAEVVADRRMPPWYGASDYKDFINHRGMNTDERRMVQSWIKGGLKRGDAPASEATTVEDVKIGWLMGEPDQILTTTENHKLPADGYVDYRYSILPYVFEEETWVEKIEILPENPEVVHHANLLAFPMDKGIRGAYFITGKVPGAEPMKLQEGVAVRIPKGTVLALQIHFTTTGREEESRLSVGLHYASGRINKSLRHVLVKNTTFEIPPGDPFYKVVKSETLEHDITGFGLFTHMHVRGRDMTFNAHYPDGRKETLLVVPNYNFDWQIGYEWAPGARRFPKGTRIECVAHFDNSEFNPFNPDPTDTVREGQQTYHEMMYGFLYYTVDDEHLNLEVDPKTGVAIKQVADSDSGS